MRRSTGSGIVLLSVLLALSVLVAFAANETASKDNVTATKALNSTLNTTNVTANMTTSQNITAPANMTSNNTLAENKTNPFANARGKAPSDEPSTDSDI